MSKRVIAGATEPRSFALPPLWDGRKAGAGAARSSSEDGPALASSPRPVIRGETPPDTANGLSRTHASRPDGPLAETGFMRLRAVLAVFPVSRSAWWDGVKKGKYPAAVKLGPRTTAWRVEDIRRLIGQYAGNAV